MKSDFGTIFGDVSVSGVIDPNDPPIVSISFYTTLECGNNDYIEAANLSVSPIEAANLSVSPIEVTNLSVSPGCIRHLFIYCGTSSR